MTDGAWIDTVRLARDMGDVSQILPAGVATVRDLPYTLLGAIRQAMYFLSFEEFDFPEDVPPRNLWNDPRAMKDWFDAVRAKHDSRTPDRDIEDPKQNDAASLLIA